MSTVGPVDVEAAQGPSLARPVDWRASGAGSRCGWRAARLLLLVALLAGCADPPRYHAIEDFEAALAAAGLPVGERVELAAAPLEAVDGRGLRIRGRLVEVYEFDPCTASSRQGLRRAVRDGIGGRDTRHRHNLVLVVARGHPARAAVEAAFERL